MRTRCMKSVCALVVLIVLTGCQKTLRQEESSLAIDPMAERITVPPQFASTAIDKAGGLEAWGKVRVILLDCVVTVYDKDAGYYLTEQYYDIYPWSDSIVISGKEADADYVWQLSQGRFEVTKGASRVKGFGGGISDSCFASSILNLVTAPARFLDKSADYSRRTDAVNIQGRWCYPITRTVKARGKKASAASNIVYYQDRDTSQIDAMLLTCEDNSSFLVSGYDYATIKDGEISVPSRIEIYTSNSEGIAQHQLLRIDISASSQK